MTDLRATIRAIESFLSPWLFTIAMASFFLLMFGPDSSRPVTEGQVAKCCMLTVILITTSSWGKDRA